MAKTAGPRPLRPEKIESQNALTLRIKVICKVLEIVKKTGLESPQFWFNWKKDFCVLLEGTSLWTILQNAVMGKK